MLLTITVVVVTITIGLYVRYIKKAMEDTKEEPSTKTEGVIFWVIGAPRGPESTTEKVRRLFPDELVFEYPPLGHTTPTLRIQGGNPEDHFRKLSKAGFKVVVPTYDHPNCQTWVDPPTFYQPLEPPLVWRPRHRKEESR